MEKLQGYQEVSPKEITENYIRLIADTWMLVTAGQTERFNTMTANWGGAGYLWNKPVVFVFIRPQRYTFEFTEQQESFTLSFLGESHREALSLCGKVSGRDVDKVKEAGLTPGLTAEGHIAFEEAELILDCRKMYAGYFRPEEFIDSALVEKVYAQGDFHKVYIAEIVKAWKK